MDPSCPPLLSPPPPHFWNSGSSMQGGHRDGLGVMPSQGHRIEEVRATVPNPLVATRSLLESWVVTVEEATFWGAEGEPLLQPTSQVPS